MFSVIADALLSRKADGSAMQTALSAFTLAALMTGATVAADLPMTYEGSVGTQVSQSPSVQVVPRLSAPSASQFSGFPDDASYDGDSNEPYVPTTSEPSAPPVTQDPPIVVEPPVAQEPPTLPEPPKGEPSNVEPPKDPPVVVEPPKEPEPPKVEPPKKPEPQKDPPTVEPPKDPNPPVKCFTNC